MIELRPFATLGGADHGWLHARHHFSFAGYQDPQRTAWGNLRVWNDDEIAGNSGFPSHPHRDMEIVTYVRRGAITHEDSLGNKGRTVAGDVQVMSAGTGIRHAEFNREEGTTTLFQIWLIPDMPGGAPSWGTRTFPKDARSGPEGARSGPFVTLASGRADDADADPLPIRTDGRIVAATLAAGTTARYVPAGGDAGRHLYLVAATGRIEVNGVAADARDGLAITGETSLDITAIEDSELVLVDAA